MMNRRTSLALGAILIALLVFFAGRYEAPESAPDYRAVKSSRLRGAGKQPRADGSPRSWSLRGPLSEEETKTHEFSDLIEFYHPRMELENVTLSEALRLLMGEYQRICEETGETTLPLRWQIDGSSRVIPKVNLEGHFQNSCRNLAIRARMHLEIIEGALVFTELEQGPVRKRTWKVPPNFADSLHRLMGQKVPDGVEVIESPFPAEHPGDLPGGPVATKRVAETAKANLSEQLGNLGILDPGDQVRVLAGSGELELTAGSGTMAMVEMLVEMTAAEMPRGIRYHLQHRIDGQLQGLPAVMIYSGGTGEVVPGPMENQGR